ncbi:DUF3231 family protein [Bacillus capparidis]|uniref:Uncharacterized protein n=3 Tax=Bacillus TaxID=1386 RepID=A0A0M3R9R6_9BACI|nr:DUF3231 family protein [Bacillus capparidis]ALC81902.1 hypothetical protein AM592_09995 [Bacillus gobiensis]MBP1083216.1 hypothetical protein [Bacillus capparidis]MED1097657.1 DUF3231 family protein [Bacillus capparidis]
MEDKLKIRLTAAEMASLWTQYMNDTASICALTHFLEKLEDEEVRPVIEFALQATKTNISFLQNLFQKEDFPIPVGFNEQDVNPTAPKLFSDSFVLMYLRNMSILGMAASSLAIGVVTRTDVVGFHKSVLDASVRLQELSKEVMLNQGIYLRPPYISVPDKVDFIEKQRFLAGFFGGKRVLTGIEITHLFINVQTNSIGKALMVGFAQVAQKQDVKQYLLRGKQIAQKHIDLFSDVLRKEDLPAPMTWDASVSDSTTKVFSDKLIMYHVTAMIAAGIGNYGTAMAASPRRDIAMNYASIIPEISLYAEDGANIMIKHGWLEEPPQADDRNQLVKG